MRNQGIRKLFSALFLILPAIFIFRAWFGFGIITAGDLPFYFRENLNGLFSFPHLWDGQHIVLLFLYPPIFLTGLLSKLGLGFVFIERLVWFWPFLLLTIFSSWYLVKTLFPKNVFWFFCPFVFLFNTYILMVIGGGQVGIAMAYASAPIVFGLFTQLINYPVTDYELRVKKMLVTGIVLAVQAVFDPRIALVTLIAVGIYLLFQLLDCEWRIADLVKNLGVSLAIAGLLHFYWILPAVLVKGAALPAGYGESGWVEFLSFARFSDSFSLLHPNWPENIFGKTYFFRPEFLILPILAFSSLLFINCSITNYELRIKRTVLFFALLGIIGAFLAKGVNPPFGGINLWLFNNVPGMNLFRDATKFYVLVALSYSILIPFSTSEIYKALSSKFKIKNYLSWLFLLFTICYLLFLIRPAWLGQLGGTFKAKEIPEGYIVLKVFIHNQDEFFRTFWVPKRQRSGFYSHNHPALSAEGFVTDFVCQEPFCSLKEEMPEQWGRECPVNDRCYVRELSYFLNPKTAKILSQMAVKYVIIPFDSEHEIFIAEREYNHQQRQEVEDFLDTISWLKKIEVAEKITVYQLPEHKNHFFLTRNSQLAIEQSSNEIKKIKMLNPTKYLVSLRISEAPVNLVFSETYDRLWQAKLGGETIFSQPHLGILNSFLIDKTGDFELIIEFEGQKYVYWGGIVSFIILCLSVGGLILLK